VVSDFKKLLVALQFFVYALQSSSESCPESISGLPLFSLSSFLKSSKRVVEDWSRQCLRISKEGSMHAIE
jgi:hypothetical protein